jgi:hypothetical protein
MAYPEYTSCTTPVGAWNHLKQGTAPWPEMIAAGIAATLGNGGLILIALAILDAANIAISAPAALGVAAIGLLIGACFMILAYCDWWLKYRLICLDDDKNHCAVGFVAEFEPRDTGFFGQFDTDFTMNIGVFGTWFGDHDLDAVSTLFPPYGYLLKGKEQHDPTSLFNYLAVLPNKSGFPMSGKNSPGDDKSSPYFGMAPMTVLHVEFEGGAVAALRDWVYALILVLLAVEAFAIACAAGFFWACIILALLALLFSSLPFVAIPESLSHVANPADIDKALGDLAVGNIVAVAGRWVYDAGHIDENRGWNEIHPIRHCQILKKNDPNPFDGNWTVLSSVSIPQWCQQISTAGHPLVKAEQQKPEHRWEIHPLMDGCKPGGESTPPSPMPIPH